AGRQNRSAQRLVDAVVHDRLEIVATTEFQVFADSIEYDDSVVHRITDERQEGGNNGKVNFAIKDRKQTEGDQRVVQRGKYGSRSINPFETERNIDQHSAESVKRRENSLSSQILADFRTYGLNATNFELTGKILFQSLSNCRAAFAGVSSQIVLPLIIDKKLA